MNKKKNLKLFLCAIIAEMDLAVMSLINSFFISRGLGADGATAYELVMPCILAVSAFLALIYNGLQVVCSEDYGARDHAAFERHKNAGYTWAFLTMGALTLLFLLLKEVILDFLGAYDASENIASLCRECYLAFLPCFLPQCFFCIASCLLFFEERRQLIVANILLYTCSLTCNQLITQIHPGMTAYVATNLLSELVADFYLIACFYVKRKQSLAIFTKINFRFQDVKKILLSGLPDWMEYVFAAIASLILNLYLLHRFSSSLVAGMGIFEAVENLPEILCVGFCFLTTAKLGTRVGRLISTIDPDETKKAMDNLLQEARFLSYGAIFCGLITSILLIVFAPSVINTFFSDTGGGEAADSAVWFLRSYAIGFIFYLLNSELICYYKLVGAISHAHVIFFAEALLFPLLAKILLGEAFGTYGIYLGNAIGELLTLGLNFCLIWKSCGRFPRHLQDFRMECHLKKLRKT